MNTIPRLAIALCLCAGLLSAAGCGIIGVLPLGGAIAGAVVATGDPGTETVEEQEPPPTDPEVSGIYPAVGLAAGGTSVQVFGNRFVAGATVTFGTAAATSVTVVSSTEITCQTPVGTGTVDVTVANPTGPPATLTNAFTYDGSGPGPVTSFQAVESSSDVVLSWANPTDGDFAGVMIRRSTTGYPSDAASGDFVYDGAGTTYTEVEPVRGYDYYYAAFAYDTVGNYSTAAADTLYLNVYPVVTSGSTLYNAQAADGTVIFLAKATDADGTITGVSLDLSPWGMAAVTMVDDGTMGDLTAGDDVYTAVVAIPAGQATGPYTFTVTATDDSSDTGQDNATLTVNDLLLGLPNKRIDTGSSSPPEYGSTDVQVATSGNVIYVVWVEDDTSATPGKQVYFNRSQDAGLTWLGTPIVVGGGPGYDSGAPKIAAAGDCVYVVYESRPMMEWQIYCATSVDGGTSWGAQTRVDGGAAGINARNPQLAMCGEVLYCAYEYSAFGYQAINFNSSNNGGSTWNLDQAISKNTAPGSAASKPTVCCAGGTVYCAWVDDRNGNTDIFFNYSQDEGQNWQLTDSRIDKAPSTSNGNNVTLCCTGELVYAAYTEDRNGNPEVFFNRSLDGGVNWGVTDTKVETDSATNTAYGPTMACDGNLVYVAWADDRNGATDIYAQASADAGSTWLTSDARLDQDAAGAEESKEPVVACCGEYAYVAWRDRRPGKFGVYLNFTQDAGQTWESTDVWVETREWDKAHSSRPVLSLRGHNLVVLWTADSEGNDGLEEVLMVRGRYVPALAVGSSDARMDTTTAGSVWSGNPDSAVSGNYVYVVWNDWRTGDDNVYMNYSTDGGATWQSPDIRVDNCPSTFDATQPRVACCGDTVHVVWKDNRNGGNGDIYYNVSRDNGATWGTTDLHLDTDSGDAFMSYDPGIVADGSYVYAYWVDRRAAGEVQIWCNSSANGGWWFGGEKRVDDTTVSANSTMPRLCAFGKNAFMVWQDDRVAAGASDVYFNKTNNGGANWDTSDQQLSQGLGDHYQPRICCTGFNVYVTWQRDVASVYNVRFSSSMDGGASPFSNPVTVDHAGPTFNAYQPDIACAGRSVYVCWLDNRNGSNDDIYFNRSHNGGANWQLTDTRIDSDSSGNAVHKPGVRCEGNTVYCFWVDGRGTSDDFWVNYTLDGGQNWAGDQRFDNDPGSNWVWNYTLAVGSNRLFAAWEDERNGAAIADIYSNALE